MRNIPYNELPGLPPNIDFEHPRLLKLTIRASRLLGELKGYCQTLPDPRLLINTLVLQESKDSSAIENIVTTQDELYRAVVLFEEEGESSPAAKEVLLYREALYQGWDLLQTRGLTTNTMIAMMQKLKNTDAAIRRVSGTKLANPQTGEIYYTPPEGESVIREKLAALEKFIHDDNDGIEPIIKMALTHYQFEAIHPFADGNGRTGRILNVLFLVQKNILTMPVLYLSSFIISHKADYYRLLREVTEQQKWNEWIEYMLTAISETAQLTLEKISAIQSLKQDLTEKIKSVLKNSYTGELVDLLFSYPYVKIKTLELKNIAHRQTASLYLQKLAQENILRPVKKGKEMYYINHSLMNILKQ